MREHLFYLLVLNGGHKSLAVPLLAPSLCIVMLAEWVPGDTPWVFMWLLVNLGGMYWRLPLGRAASAAWLIPTRHLWAPAALLGQLVVAFLSLLLLLVVTAAVGTALSWPQGWSPYLACLGAWLGFVVTRLLLEIRMGWDSRALILLPLGALLLLLLGIDVYFYLAQLTPTLFAPIIAALIYLIHPDPGRILASAAAGDES